MVWLTVYWLFLFECITCSQKVFSVNDDVFAYPQFQIDFSPSYILEDDAIARIRSPKFHDAEASTNFEEDDDLDGLEYKEMLLHNRRYLCSIPHVKPINNTVEDKPSKEDQKKELVRAADRGWQLLQDMEGKQCLYYSTGWWSYSFCYNSHVKQFHSLPPAPGGVRPWPPQEDQSTPSYYLGKYEPKSQGQDSSTAPSRQQVNELQTRADGNYLVQRLDGGTPCDLTGKNRRVEIEFHCHPQTTDRIGWIKETTTCAYLMVIYTPRLCNDVAFQPPRDSQAHIISCQEIFTIDEAQRIHEDEKEPITIDSSEEKPIMIGNIQLGAMEHVGKDGKKLERGRVVMTAEEKAEIIIMQKDGQIQGLSRTKMKELNLKPDDIEKFKKEVQEIAGSSDWKIERFGDENGDIHLRAIVAADGKDGGEQREAADEEGETGKNDEKPKTEL